MAAGSIRYRPGGPSELTVRLGGRLSRLSGTVRFPDGRPAQRILLIASLPSSGWLPAGCGTDDNGKYIFNTIEPGFSRMLGIFDENWAGTSVISAVSKDGQDQGGLDFTLVKGTLIHGRVTEGSEHRPSAGTRVVIVENGGPLPKELRHRVREHIGFPESRTPTLWAVISSGSEKVRYSSTNGRLRQHRAGNVRGDK